MTKKKVIITGACGFIGSSLSEHLNQNSFQTVLIDNLKFGYLENLSIENQKKLVIADCYSDMNKIDELITPDSVIVHLAGISSLPECESNPKLAYEHNVVAFINMLTLAAKKKVNKVIFATTSAVYENNTSYPFKEDMVVKPDLIYSQTKHICEQVAASFSKNYGLSIICSRFFNVYGSKQDRKRKNPPFTAYLMNCFENKTTPVVYNWTDVKRDYIYYKDLNEILERMINSEENFNGDIFNCCSGNGYSTKAIYSLVQQAYGYKMSPKIGEPQSIWDNYNLKSSGFDLNRISKEVFKESLGDNSKVINKFGYMPKYTFEDGLSDILKKQ